METQEFYIGQKFYQPYPPEAATWCDNNNAMIEEKHEEHAYVSKVDVLHAQKMRHQVLGDWTEEDEAEYEANVIRLSQEIAERYPYPTEV